MSQYAATAVIETVDGTPIGHMKDVSYGFTPRPIVEHDISGGDPDIHEPGQLEYTISGQWGYVDDIIRAAIKNTKVVVIVYPRGNVAGRPRHTLTDVILSWEGGVERNSVIGVNVTGSYRTETIDTV